MAGPTRLLKANAVVTRFFEESDARFCSLSWRSWRLCAGIKNKARTWQCVLRTIPSKPDAFQRRGAFVVVILLLSLLKSGWFIADCPSLSCPSLRLTNINLRVILNIWNSNGTWAKAMPALNSVDLILPMY